MRHIHQCCFQLILQSAAGGDNPPAEVAQLGWTLGQKRLNLGSPLGNVVVHALNVGRVDAAARVEFKCGLQRLPQVMSYVTRKCPRPGTVSRADLMTSAALSIPCAESIAFRPSLIWGISAEAMSIGDSCFTQLRTSPELSPQSMTMVDLAPRARRETSAWPGLTWKKWEKQAQGSIEESKKISGFRLAFAGSACGVAGGAAAERGRWYSERRDLRAIATT